MEEYTDFLRKCLGERRDITKKVFKIVGRIYKAVKNGATEEQINLYVTTLKKLMEKWVFSFRSNIVGNLDNNLFMLSKCVVKKNNKMTHTWKINNYKGLMLKICNQ